LQHETRDGDGQSASHNQGGEELAVANRAESDNGDAAADTTPLHGTLIASTQEDFNPWIKQREPRRRSYRVRKPPAPFSKDEYDGKITVCVTSTLDESVFDSEDAEELVDYIHTMLYSLFCAEENLKVEDWKGVQEAFEPMLRTRRTLLRVFLEDFFDVEFKPKKKSTRKQPKGKWVRSGKMLALSGRGMSSSFCSWMREEFTLIMYDEQDYLRTSSRPVSVSEATCPDMKTNYGLRLCSARTIRCTRCGTYLREMSTCGMFSPSRTTGLDILLMSLRRPRMRRRRKWFGTVIWMMWMTETLGRIVLTYKCLTPLLLITRELQLWAIWVRQLRQSRRLLQSRQLRQLRQ
jgi:hypothetical protein